MEKIKEKDIKYFNIDAFHLVFEKSNFDLLIKNDLRTIDTVFWKVYIEEIEKSTNRNFFKELFFKIEYKSKKYNILKLKFWNKDKKLELGWKIFRLAMLEETSFWVNDIFDFVWDNFFDFIIRRVDVAIDIQTKDKDFLEKLYKELIKNWKIKDWSIGSYQKWVTFESINFWDIKEKKNWSYYYKIYDKKLEIEERKTAKPLYLNYFDTQDKIIRFEFSIRKDNADEIDIKDLYFKNNKNITLYNIWITYFEKKWIDIFEEINYKRTLVKTIQNRLKWSLETKIDKSKNLKKLKWVNTILKNIEDEIWEDRVSLLKNLDDVIRKNEDYKEYVFLYQQIFENIFVLYEDWNVDELDFEDLTKIINWWLEYISDYLDISVDEFLAKIHWCINDNIESVFWLFSDKIVKVIYLYYLTKQFKNDNIFSFMKIVDESNLDEFNKFFDKKFAKTYISKLKNKVKYISNSKDINSSNLFSIIVKEYE